MASTAFDAERSENTSLGDTAMENQNGESKQTYKSFKKKFRKMKHKFDAAMNQSNELFLEEQKAKATMKKLAKGNDQMLDLLLDMNNSAQLPADKRINITSDVPGLSPIPSLVSDDDVASIGTLQTPEGQAIIAEIQTMLAERKALAEASRPPRSISHLLTNTPHLSLDNPSLSADLLTSLESEAAGTGGTVPNSYLTLDQLEDYLYEEDMNLGHERPLAPQFHNPMQHDLAFGNHHSPYNWLRRNQPQIFLQDGEGSEKSHGKPGALRGAGKRASIPAPSKPDALEIVEEDGQGYEFALGGPSTTKGGKRKRDDGDDGGYHPKSGVRGGDESKAKKPRQTKKKAAAAKGEDGEGSAVKEKAPSKRARKPKIPSPDPDAHPFGPMR